MALLLLGCVSGVAATLSAGGQTANPGQSLTIPLTFSASGASISGIQFDLQWSTPLSLSITSGDQLLGSTKSLYGNLLGMRDLRCLIVGINNTDQLPDGVLLNLVIDIDPAAATSTATINIAGVVATTPTGTAATVTSGPVSIQIQGAATTQLPVQSILNAASLASGPVSPGEIVSLFAPFGSSGTPVILFNGTAAPILYSGSNQVNAIVPFNLNLTQPASVQIQIANRVGTAQLSTAPATPAVFALSGEGFGPGAILNQDYSVNSAANPAPRGSIVMCYGTGFGLVNGPVTDGAIQHSAMPFVLPVTASVSGVSAQVTYAGTAPGLVAGAAQINVQIPSTIPASSNAQVLLMAGPASSPSGITVAIR